MRADTDAGLRLLAQPGTVYRVDRPLVRLRRGLLRAVRLAGRLVAVVAAGAALLVAAVAAGLAGLYWLFTSG